MGEAGLKLADLAGRRVIILGLAREGLALLDALRDHPPAEIAIADRDPTVGERLPAWLRGRAVVHAPSPDLAQAADYEIVVKSPGVPPRTPGVQSALAAGRVVTSATRLWFAEAAGHRVVGVTGTKGKSTTATLLYRCLRDAGWNVHLLGNVGVPAMSVLPRDAGHQPVFIFELSSFQLWDLDRSPQVAVLLNLYTDHLDWHPSREDYVSSKLRIARFQGAQDVLVHHGRDPGIAAAALPGRARRCPYAIPGGISCREGWFLHGNERLFPADVLRLPGEHNRENACAVLTVLSALGLAPGDFEETFARFEGLPHRLQTVRTVAGTIFVDDSIATGPDAAVRAIDCFPGRPKVLILGGNAKGISPAPLVRRLLAGDVVGAVLMQESGRALGEVLRKTSGFRGCLCEAQDMDEAVRLAARLASPGGVVLLAPGAASAPPYRDYVERGDDFRRAVLALPEEGED